MKKNRINLTETQLHRVIKESIRKILRENDNNILELENSIKNTHFHFYGKCTDMDAEEVQDFTHWDEYCNNDYAISDDYYNDGIYVVSLETFLQATQGEMRPEPQEIDYCAWNDILGILFCYTTNDIHYFYK